MNIDVPAYEEHGLCFEWEPAYSIKCTVDNGSVYLEANRDGLVSLVRHLLMLAQEIVQGAEGIRLENMAQTQRGCLHVYDLSISDMKLLVTADIFIINGGGMESFLEQALERYPELTVVDTSEGIALLEEEVHHHHDDEEEAEAHEHEQEHEYEGNSHIWLSPARTAQQAENIAAALSEMDQADAAVFAENAARFKAETDALLQEAAQLNLPEGTEAEVFHEGFAYFAELFGMEIASGIFVDEYQVPSAKELTEAADEAREHKIQFFLTAADDGRIYAETLAQETGETITLLDPLTTAAEGNPSYTERMRRNIQAVAQHWKEAAA